MTCVNIWIKLNHLIRHCWDKGGPDIVVLDNTLCHLVTRQISKTRSIVSTKVIALYLHPYFNSFITVKYTTKYPTTYSAWRNTRAYKQDIELNSISFAMGRILACVFLKPQMRKCDCSEPIVSSRYRQLILMGDAALLYLCILVTPWWFILYPQATVYLAFRAAVVFWTVFSRNICFRGRRVKRGIKPIFGIWSIYVWSWALR